jgi:hypothetical protein
MLKLLIQVPQRLALDPIAPPNILVMTIIIIITKLFLHPPKFTFYPFTLVVFGWGPTLSDFVKNPFTLFESLAVG